MIEAQHGAAHAGGGQPVTSGAEHLPQRFPLTDMQVAYLVGKSRLIELGGRQNYYIELDVVGLDPERTEEALNLLVKRQEHLRTVMLEEGEQRVMDASAAPHLDVPVIDLTGLLQEKVQRSLKGTRDRMCEQGGLDPTDWPLFEVVISRIRRRRSRIHLRMNLVLLDGPSLRRCIEEWLVLYRDPAAQLPSVTRTFRQWRLALADFERTEAFAKQWAYWEARLDTLPEAPRLPLAQQPRTIESVSFVGRRSFLTRSQWENLKANYRKHRVLATTGLLHVYAEMLGAWADSSQFCLNVVHQNIAARHGGAQDVVGQRSATLPLEVDLRDADFWARARQLQRQLFRDMDNSDVTAVRIGRELAARRGWSQRAAFPYVFTSNQGPGWDTAMVARPAFRLLDRVQHTPQVLIDDQIRDAPDGGVSSMLDFVEEAFPPGLPDLMVAAYRRLLEALSRPDGADISPDVVSPAHRRLIADINNTGAPVPAGRLEDGFLRQAASRPDAAAVITTARTLTYRELEARSRAAARWLREHGIGRHHIVPVVMHKGWEQVVAVLGILRAGAAYCPIDANTPAQRLRHLVQDCHARAVLVQHGGGAEAGLDPALAVLEVDGLAADTDGEGLPDVEADAADLAYVIYTSGSTGSPKGVMIEHRSALNTVLDINQRIGLGPSDRVFGISSLSFDLSVWDLFGSLSAGAVIVLPEPSSRPDPVRWAAMAQLHGATVCNFVPALAEMLVECVEQRAHVPPPPIRAFLLSGDWIPTSLPGRMRVLWQDVRVVAMGGATEASIWSNIYEVGEVDPTWPSIPYGRPLTNQTMTVLDHRLDLAQPWAVGRIHIGGVGLARGYWRDEERTADRFIRHPATGERLYRTGDLGRYWPDGTIEFLGREDRQIKIQGFRVEPGEVEAAIQTHPAVRDCVVAVETAPAGHRLVALVVPVPDQPLDGQALVRHLRARLPHHLVPGRVHVVATLPLTANGKVDVGRALAELSQRVEPDTVPVPTGEDTPLMRRLAELWAELLEVPVVTADDNFFALGGNSLFALRMVNQVRRRLGLEVALGQVFEASSVRQLAASIEQGGQLTRCAVQLSDRPGAQLFLFHVVGGAIARYVPLAQEWPGPVHAFQCRALFDRSDAAFAPDLETMAAAYREELQRRQPSGPYVLGGWSSGGLLAYEVARQLGEDGGHPTNVFMIDSEVRQVHLPPDERERHLAFLVGLANGAPPEPVVKAVLDAETGSLTQAARDACVAHELLPAEVDVAGYQWLMRIQDHELRLMSAHQPSRSDRPTMLFLATEEVERPDPVPAWQAVCANLTVQRMTANHFTIMDHFEDIVDRVTHWLAKRGGHG